MHGKNKLINNMDNINTKIRKILDNNLIANLIIIFIGLIASTFVTSAVFILMNNRISRFLMNSEYLFTLLIPFFHLFYFFSLSLIFHINKNFNLKNILITFLSVVFILIIDLSTSFFIVSIDNNDFFIQIYIIKYIFNNIIFFIIIALSYNCFKILNSKTISEFFTFSADISIFACLIAGVVSTVFGIFAAIVLFLIKDIFTILDEGIIIRYYNKVNNIINIVFYFIISIFNIYSL